MISVADDKTEIAGTPDRPFLIAAALRSASGRLILQRVKQFVTDQHELLLASLRVVGIVSRLAWRKEIARRRLAAWARSFVAGWFSRKLRRVVPDSGYCFRAPAPRRAVSDQDGTSMLILLENDAPLAAPHTAHEEIRRLGHGRYSHWGRCIYFSSSDNTDPRKNGRVYRLVRRI
jgi:hypothetical protein